MSNIVAITAYFSVFLFVSAWALACIGRPVPRALVHTVYTSGAVGIVVHIVCAYGIAHRWSHQAALDHTAEETLQTIGFAFPSGLYANFAFAAIYCADAAWRWHVREPIMRRLRWLAHAVDAFLIFVIIVATLIF